MKQPIGPHAPAPYTAADMVAFKALAMGDADEAQQRRVLDWITVATGLKDVSYWPGDTHATAFAEGKRFVGLQVAKMLTMRLEQSGEPKEGR